MCIFASVMLQKYVGIVLHTVKYNDKANIVHVYTEQSGRISFLIPVQRSRKSAVKQVLFQPLSVVEFEADMRPRSGIHPIKEAKAWYVFTSLPYDPYKLAITVSGRIPLSCIEGGNYQCFFICLSGSLCTVAGCL